MLIIQIDSSYFLTIYKIFTLLLSYQNIFLAHFKIIKYSIVKKRR